MSAQGKTRVYREIVDRQRARFHSNVTKSLGWRIEQLDRLSRMLSEHHSDFAEAVGRDFKTASSEKIFEVAACLGVIEHTQASLEAWMRPVEVPVPAFLAASGHKGILYREPYGVTLIIGPFNAPLLNLLRPATTALAAGNPCILKVPEAPATARLLLDLVPKYFDADAVEVLQIGRAHV